MNDHDPLRDDLIRGSRQQALARAARMQPSHEESAFRQALVSWLPMIIGGTLAGWAITRRSRLAQLCGASLGAGILATFVIGRHCASALSTPADAELWPFPESDDSVDEASAASFPASDPPAHAPSAMRTAGAAPAFNKIG